MAFERPPEVTDPKAMRALAHPVRIALLEELAVHGQLTATEAGELVGESPANTSFHLRQLAKYGYVEEAEGGTGRRRPWKRVALGMRFTEVHEDPETAAAARELSRTMSHRYLERAAKGLEDNRSLAGRVAQGHRLEPDGHVPHAATSSRARPRRSSISCGSCSASAACAPRTRRRTPSAWSS